MSGWAVKKNAFYFWDGENRKRDDDSVWKAGRLCEKLGVTIVVSGEWARKARNMNKCNNDDLISVVICYLVSKNNWWVLSWWFCRSNGTFNSAEAGIFTSTAEESLAQTEYREWYGIWKMSQENIANWSAIVVGILSWVSLITSPEYMEIHIQRSIMAASFKYVRKKFRFFMGTYFFPSFFFVPTWFICVAVCGATTTREIYQSKVIDSDGTQPTPLGNHNIG